MRVVNVSHPNLTTSLRVVSESFSTQLNKMGIESHVFGSPKEALKYLTKHEGEPPIVFVWDMQLIKLTLSTLKFVRQKVCILVHANGVDEFVDPTWIGYVLWLKEEPYWGTPVRMVAISEFTRQAISGRLLKVLNPALTRAIMRKVVPIPYGIDECFVDEGRNDRNEFVAPFTRLVGVKDPVAHAKETLKVKAVLAQRGVPSKHVMFLAETPSSRREEKWDLASYDIEEPYSTREGLAERLRTVGIAMSTSKSESFGLFYLELIMSGCVVVFRDEAWNRMLLPGYRYRCGTSQLASMALNVWEDYENARSYLQNEVQPYVRKYYSTEGWAKKMIEFAESAAV